MKLVWIWWGWSYALIRPVVLFRRPSPESAWATLCVWCLVIGPFEVRRMR